MSDTDAIAASYGLAVWLPDWNGTGAEQLVMYAPLKVANTDVTPVNDAEAATLGRACVLDISSKDKTLAVLFARGNTYVTKSTRTAWSFDDLEGGGQVHTMAADGLDEIEANLERVCSLGGAFPMIVSERKIDLPDPEVMAEMPPDEQRRLFITQMTDELRWWGNVHDNLVGADADRFAALVDDVANQMSVAFIDMMVSDKDAYLVDSDEDARETVKRNRNMYEQTMLFQARVNMATATLTAGLRAASAAEPTIQDVVSTETLDDLFNGLDALLAEATETNGDNNE